MKAGEIHEVLYANRFGTCHFARLIERSRGGRWRVELLDRTQAPRGGIVTVDTDDIIERVPS